MTIQLVRGIPMDSNSIADAKARLSDLVSRAAAGETVSITRRGKPIARLVAVKKPLQRIDAAMLKKVTEGMPDQDQSAGDFLRDVRDAVRY